MEWHNFRAHLNWQTVNEITPHHTCIVQSYKRQVLNKAATEAVVYVGLRRLALERVSIIRRGGRGYVMEGSLDQLQLPVA